MGDAAPLHAPTSTWSTVPSTQLPDGEASKMVSLALDRISNSQTCKHCVGICSCTRDFQLSKPANTVWANLQLYERTSNSQNLRTLCGQIAAVARRLPTLKTCEHFVGNLHQACRLMGYLQKLEHAAEKGSVPHALAAEAQTAYVTFCKELNDVIGDASRLSEKQRVELGIFVSERLSPYVALAASANRWRSKPRGYAGDDVSIQMIYDGYPAGDASFAQTIDSLFLAMPAAQAVRTRRQILASRIETTYNVATGRRPVRIMAMAAGPAAELFDAWNNLGCPSDLHAYLVDGDPAAVEALQQRSTLLMANGAQTSTKLCVAARKASLAHVALGRIKLDAPMQDVVYSLGLSDYLKDNLVVKLLDVAYGLLYPGGVVIVGNFHESNPDKACLDHVIQWKLIHRTEDDMHRLMKASRFGTGCEEILRDATGIQMLAIGRKPFESSL